MPDARQIIGGLYAITRDEPATAKLVDEVNQAMRGGVRLVQYRNKAAAASLAKEQASALRTATSAAGATLIINDDVELALAVHADGVHLGREDGVSDDGAEAFRLRQFPWASRRLVPLCVHGSAGGDGNRSNRPVQSRPW